MFLNTGITVLVFYCLFMLSLKFIWLIWERSPSIIAGFGYNVYFDYFSTMVFVLNLIFLIFPTINTRLKWLFRGLGIVLLMILFINKNNFLRLSILLPHFLATITLISVPLMLNQVPFFRKNQ